MAPVTSETQSRTVRVRRGCLKDLPTMSVDILTEVMSHLMPCDILHLSRTSKDFRQFLMARASEFIWRRARQNFVGLPPLPEDLSEPAVAQQFESGQPSGISALDTAHHVERKRDRDYFHVPHVDAEFGGTAVEMSRSVLDGYNFGRQGWHLRDDMQPRLAHAALCAQWAKKMKDACDAQLRQVRRQRFAEPVIGTKRKKSLSECSDDADHAKKRPALSRLSYDPSAGELSFHVPPAESQREQHDPSQALLAKARDGVDSDTESDILAQDEMFRDTHSAPHMEANAPKPAVVDAVEYSANDSERRGSGFSVSRVQCHEPDQSAVGHHRVAENPNPCSIHMNEDQRGGRESYIPYSGDDLPFMPSEDAAEPDQHPEANPDTSILQVDLTGGKGGRPAETVPHGEAYGAVKHTPSGRNLHKSCVELLHRDIEGPHVAVHVDGLPGAGIPHSIYGLRPRYTAKQRSQASILDAITRSQQLQAERAPAPLYLPPQQNIHGAYLPHVHSLSSTTAYNTHNSNQYSMRPTAELVFPSSVPFDPFRSSFYPGVQPVGGAVLSHSPTQEQRSYSSVTPSSEHGPEPPALRLETRPKPKLTHLTNGLVGNHHLPQGTMRSTPNSTTPSQLETSPLQSFSSDGKRSALNGAGSGSILANVLSSRFEALEVRLTTRINDAMGELEARMLELFSGKVKSRRTSVETEGYAADDESEDESESGSGGRTRSRMASDHPFRNQIHRTVRDSLMHYLGLHAGCELVPSATTRQVQDFEDGNHPGPSVPNLCLDYDSPATSAYNEAAFQAFGEWFAMLVSQCVFPELPPLGWMTGEYFAAIAQSKFRLLRDRYRAASPPDAESGETTHNKSLRVSTAYTQSLALHRRRRRKANLYTHRKRLIETSPKSSPRLEVLCQLLNLLGTDAMSSDETEDDVSVPQRKRVRRKRRHWLNPIITTNFAWLDSCYTRVKTTGQLVSGNSFRDRIYEHNKDSTGRPKQGLPRNVYDSTFLDAISTDRRRRLRLADRQAVVCVSTGQTGVRALGVQVRYTPSLKLSSTHQLKHTMPSPKTHWLEMVCRERPDYRALTWSDGVSTAVSFDGDLIVMSLTMAFVPLPTCGHITISLRADGHFGAADPIHWPQVMEEGTKYPWMTVIRRKPEGKKDTIMWSPLTYDHSLLVRTSLPWATNTGKTHNVILRTLKSWRGHVAVSKGNIRPGRLKRVRTPYACKRRIVGVYYDSNVFDIRSLVQLKLDSRSSASQPHSSVDSLSLPLDLSHRRLLVLR
ncbi:hypothetical protein NM688_g4418 [Phlebia brevispora]|uniref:Uncharacterized protein n=1 Tax=Phlebia brevispora TaxID=194682 RepID=A0ACC1T310_9APHY|nr:hypothetical protein NM688_g4418 [Phlebia brevispora]